MEQPSKRQRISRVFRRSTIDIPRSGVTEQMSSMGVPSGLDEDPKDSPLRGPHSGPSIETQGVTDSNQKQVRSIGGRSALGARHRQLHGGQMVPRHNTGSSAPMKTVIQSVVQVVVENGQSSVGALTLPMVPTVVPFPSYGPLTVPAVPPYPSAPPPTLPTVPAYPFTTTAPLDSSNAVISASSNSVNSGPTSSVISASSNAATSAPAIAPEPSSPLQSSNSTRTNPSSSQTLQLSSSSNLPLSHSSIQSASVRTSSDFPSLTAVGNFSIITFTYSDSTTTFTTTSTIPIETTSSPLSLTSTTETSASNTLSSSSETTSQLSSGIIPTTTSADSSSAAATHSSSFHSSSTGTGVGGVGGGGAGTATGSASGTSQTAGASGNGSDPGNSTAPPTPTVVGSVVGGVAGLALLAVLLLFLIRWHRRRKRAIEPAHESEVAPPGTAQSGVMTERSSNTPLAAAALAPGFLRRLRPLSSQTTGTVETAPSERGFQNLGGRKLPSVFTVGGDGFGGGYDKETLAGSSFYRDSGGNFYGGAGSPTGPGFAGPSAGPSGRGTSAGSDARNKEVAVMRPSPARTPVTSPGGFEGLPSPPRGPSTPRGATPPAIGSNPRDLFGRSRPSFTGSRGSKFTEETI